MILLKMETFSNGTETPVSLEIDNITYDYNKDKLFEKLVDQIDKEILVIKTGFKNTEKIYQIEEVILGDIPTIKLN
jgi:hypothetical protein